MNRYRVFVDADVLFAASVSSSYSSASVATLTMSEVTTIDAITCQRVIVEAERNLTKKMPKGLATFRLLVERALRIVPDPAMALVDQHQGKADPKDLPILVAAHREQCPILVTFNVRHFRPGIQGVEILQPGQFIQRVRHQLTLM